MQVRVSPSSSVRRVVEMFAVEVAKERFKFSCAHFVAFKGFRERLHGHNYQVGVTLTGARSDGRPAGDEGYFGYEIGQDGYVLDFGVVKEHAAKICKSWNEHVIIPMESDVLKIDAGKVNGHLAVSAEDGAEFLFPIDDCLCLPIRHSTAEEMAMHFTFMLVESITLELLRERRIETIKVSVGETPNQLAWFQLPLSEYEAFRAKKIKIQPKPCIVEARGEI